MANVRVWNDNKFDHVEKYKGDTIKIKSGEFVVMDREEAVQFKSNFYTPKYHANGVQTQESKKMIRLERIDGAVAAPALETFNCMACGFKAKSNAALTQHIAHKHKDIMVDDDAKKELEAGA
jgi:hypothetical protein